MGMVMLVWFVARLCCSKYSSRFEGLLRVLVLTVLVVVTRRVATMTTRVVTIVYLSAGLSLFPSVYPAASVKMSLSLPPPPPFVSAFATVSV